MSSHNSAKQATSKELLSGLEACQWIVDLFTWSDDGDREPKPPYSWETCARMAGDYARGALRDATPEPPQASKDMSDELPPHLAPHLQHMLTVLGLENIAKWLENGCSPAHAAAELRLLARRQKPPATAHEPCSAPVAWVPIHPTTGPLWANTIASKDSDHPRSYPLMPLYATQPPAEQPSVTEIIRQMRGRAAASDAGGTIEVLLSDLRSVVTGMQRAAQPPVPVVHGVVYDRGGWICSICHGWNCLKEKHCQHVHSGSAATKESAR